MRKLLLVTHLTALWLVTLNTTFPASQARNRLTKNEIFAEAIGGLVGGMAAGGAATLYVVSMATPVGWMVTLVLGVGVAVAAYSSGKGAKYLYTTKGEAVDITGLTRVDQLCK